MKSASALGRVCGSLREMMSACHSAGLGRVGRFEAAACRAALGTAWLCLAFPPFYSVQPWAEVVSVLHAISGKV